jgi:hypothetical protein
LPDEYAGWDSSFFASSAALPAPQYLGLLRPEAEALAAASGITAVRVADLDTHPNIVLKLDRRTDRLTLLVHRGRVVRAAFF